MSHRVTALFAPRTHPFRPRSALDDAPDTMGGPDHEPLHLQGGPFALRREPRDRGWAVALAALYAGSLAFAAYAWCHR